MILKSSSWHTQNPCPSCGVPMEDYSSETEFDFRCPDCGTRLQGEFES